MLRLGSTCSSKFFLSYFFSFRERCNVNIVRQFLWQYLYGSTPKFSSLPDDLVNYNINHLLWECQNQTTCFEKIVKNTTHRGLRRTHLFFVEYWKSFGKYKYYLKKITKTQRKSNRRKTYFSAVSFNELNNFLLFLEIYSYLHRLIYCAKDSFCFFPSIRLGGHHILLVKSSK